MKKSIILFVLSAFFLCAFSQQSITLGQLANTSWKLSINDPGYSSKKSFTRSCISVETIYEFPDLRRIRQRKVVKYTCPFYLSNSIPDKFDDSKVGKVKSGKYIVMKIKSGKACYEVISFTSQLLCLKAAYLRKDEVIGLPEVIRYVRID